VLLVGPGRGDRGNATEMRLFEPQKLNLLNVASGITEGICTKSPGSLENKGAARLQHGLDCGSSLDTGSGQI